MRPGARRSAWRIRCLSGYGVPVRVLAAVGLAVFIAGCSGGGDRGGTSSAPPPSSQPSALDLELTSYAVDLAGLTGDPAKPRGVVQARPDDNALLKLGQLLFFSQTLSAGYDVSCGTCHHPDFGASDGLSISVGVVPTDAAAVGPGRRVDIERDRDPSADGGPNMHRNSITTFNAALFDRNLMYDGRVHVLDDVTMPGGHGQDIQTPESGQRADPDQVSGLLEFTVKGPIVNDNEMRGYLYTQYPTAAEYREHLVRRFRGDVDTEYNPKPGGPANWLAHFRTAFGVPGATPDGVITMENIQRALAAYVESQIFVDTPWRDFLDGDYSALSTEAKQGALLFLKSPAEGGLGCAACHSGDRFSDEAFHNVGFPQIGRGFLRADNNDLGRWTTTRRDEDLHAFRTPSLLNVALTAPYGHAGAFDSLRDTIRYHADPRAAIEAYDFSLLGLNQFRTDSAFYPYAESHTYSALNAPTFAAAEALLPHRALTAQELTNLVAFLTALTDRCAADAACVSDWTPAASEDPDGNMLVRDAADGPPPDVDAPDPDDYPSRISLNFPPTSARTSFADVQSCVDGQAMASNTGETRFVQRTESSFGLDDAHAYSRETWFDRPSIVEIAMIGGGVSAGYVDDDCWLDLVFTSGAVEGMIFYRNLVGSSFEPVDLLPGYPELEFSGAAMVDLDGDYRREILLGNVNPGELPIFARNEAGQYVEIAALPMVRPTYGISFSPLDATGAPYFYLAHWSPGSGNDAGTSPTLWRNDGASLYPWDVPAQTTPAFVDQRFNFTPKFADFTGDGLTDLVIASDFLTSSTLRNTGDPVSGPVFSNETLRHVISDQNGMGSALLDIDNDGVLEWFVTSVYEDTGEPAAGNWGQSGNRLYRNTSTEDRIAFEDITSASGVRDGYWGWGACAADVNNDGFVDLFHGNGFGHIPDDVATDTYSETELARYARVTVNFRGKPSRLFINEGDGTLTESAMAWNIDAPSEGRGVVCLDYDRDGDIDIGVFDHSTGLQFFENQSGSGVGRRFVNLRLVGEPPNTDAIGGRVYVTADIGNGFGTQTQLRLSEANSNFNSQNPPDLHFGLGAAATMDEIRVVWPDGSELVCNDVASNQFLILDQRDGEAACP